MINEATQEKLMTILSKVKVLCLLLLCIWCAHLMATLTWAILAPQAMPEWKAQHVSSGISKSSSSAPSRFNIASALLFGEAPKEAPKVETKTEAIKAPKTRLRLKLLGVFVGQTDQQSTAIISEQGKSNAEFYRVGDTIQNGVLLEQVQSDRVILKRNGRLETLYFDDFDSLFESVAKPSAKPKPIRPEQIKTRDQFVDAAKQHWGSNPIKALNSIGAVPVSQDGQSLGYRISKATPMMKRYGLENGDVIRSVDGIDVGNVNEDGQRLDELFQQDSVSVVIERGSRQIDVTIPLR